LRGVGVGVGVDLSLVPLGDDTPILSLTNRRACR
jgi:hypothetical protein